ncbi:MAG TPA: preprotein translocase subunit YajC [Clostridiales bacterium]|nr:preprotein translocase subunit YajC [Clostridiales bacterium]
MPEEGAAGLAGLGGVGFILYIVFIIGIMYLLVFLPQKKRDKKAKEMISSLKVGDKVVTIGGLAGKIINIKDDEVTVETGVEKTKMTLKNWAIKEVDKPIEA